MAGHTAEPAFNALFALALDRRHPRWDVHAEQAGVLRGLPGMQPDLVITPHGRAGEPVIIETEYQPAATVEADAASRLGAVLDQTGHKVQQAVAVRIPTGLDDLSTSDLSAAISTVDFEYILIRQSAQKQLRFPRTGWINGTVDDLAGFCERISLNQHLLKTAVDLLERTVDSTADNFRSALGSSGQKVLDDIAKALHQADHPQTSRMAIAIIANALLFQSAIEGRQQGHLQVPRTSPGLSQSQVLSDWKSILGVNYHPVFAIASQLLIKMPPREAQKVISSLTSMTHRLQGLGVTATGEMAGQMFGRLITDRKFLATFYTRPESASLLAEIAVQRLTDEHDLSSHEAVRALRIADWSCGTGSLLAAAYQRIATRVRRGSALTGDGDREDDELLHPAMIEKVLIGADIMPAAVHLTATLLASMHPTVLFDDSSVHLMPYGDPVTGAKVGALELLDLAATSPNSIQRWLSVGSSPQKATGAGDEIQLDFDTMTIVPQGKLDLAIMNPPFSRTTNHEAKNAGVPLPAFAGFNTSRAEQVAMGKRLKTLNREIDDLAYHGNVGLASSFLDLAHATIKQGGILAIILPLTMMQGGDWHQSRFLLSKYYSNLCVIAIAPLGDAAKDKTARSFSKDTGMAEVLIIASKNSDAGSRKRVLYANLFSRPSSIVEAVEIARSVERIAGWQPHGSIFIGMDEVGRYTWAELDDGGCAGAVSEEVVRCAMSMSRR